MGDREQQARPAAAAEQAPAQAAAGPQPQRGTFLDWAIMIVPDGYNGAMPRTNWIRASTKAHYEALYSQIAGGSTQLKIFETSGSSHGHSNTSYPGFKDRVLRMIKRLLTVHPGRQLISGIANGGSEVWIRPSEREYIATTYSDSSTDDRNGTGTGSIVYMDPTLNNSSIQAYDARSNTIASPVYLILGHELIHARHNQLGTRDTTARTDGYDDNEEYNAIAGGPGVTENQLRRSYGLGQRDGHDINDTGARD